MFEQLVNRSSPLLSRRAAIASMGAAGLAATALGRNGQESKLVAPSLPQPPKAPAAAAMPDLNGAGFYRFKIGGMSGTTVTLLTDGSFPFGTPFPMFGANADKAAVEAAAAEVMIPPAKLIGHVHGLLIDTGKERILIDSGCGSGMGPTTGRLLKTLALAGHAPGAINAVVITHAHPDHVGGLMEEKGLDVFPNAQYFVHKAEVDFWTGPNPDLSGSKADFKMKSAMTMTAKTLFTQLTESYKARFHQIADNDKVLDLDAVRLVHAPGHTPGHSAVRITSGSDALFFITDLAHHAPIQFPHPDWHVAFDTDPVQAAKTRRTLLEKAAGDKTLISGSHLPFPAVGYVRKQGEGFVWVPRVWEW